MTVAAVPDVHNPHVRDAFITTVGVMARPTPMTELVCRCATPRPNDYVRDICDRCRKPIPYDSRGRK